MADKAGLYEALWRPEDIGARVAEDIIDVVEVGLKDIKARPEYFKQFNASNGWGVYTDFVPFVEKYLKALKDYPKAVIRVDR